MYRTPIFLLLTACMIAAIVVADVPDQISYQGRLLDDVGAPVSNTADLTFSVYSDFGGTNLLWTETHANVAVEDGLFTVMLGHNVSFPASLFDGGTRYLGVQVSGGPMSSDLAPIVSTAYAIRAANADTAAYAHSGPGSGASGWVDDGSVVRLATSGDKVGIGTSAPSERLVVGKDLGFYGLKYIVSGSYFLDAACGYKMGFSSDHQTTLQWDGDGAPFAIHTREGGVDYQNTLVSQSGNIGIGTTYPSAKLTVGDDLTAFSSNILSIGDADITKAPGISFGQNADNRGWMAYDNEDDFVYLGTKENGTFYNHAICFKERYVGIGGIADPSGELCVDGSGNSSVQLGNDAISDLEILDEPGIAADSRSSMIELEGTSPVAVCTRTVDFPTAGYAVILGTCEIEGARNDLHVDLAIIDQSNPATSQVYTRFINSDDEINSGYDCISLHEVFVVTAGSSTYQLTAANLGSHYARSWDASLTVMFFPTNYGPVDAVAGVDGDQPDLASTTAQPMLFANEVSKAKETTHSSIDEVASLWSEIADVRIENAELKARLEAIETLLNK